MLVQPDRVEVKCEGQGHGSKLKFTVTDKQDAQKRATLLSNHRLCNIAMT